MDPPSGTEDPAPPRKKRLDDDHRRTNEGKTVILFGLLLTDLVFNSTLEYDEWDSYPTMFGIQVFIEICTFAVVFLMLCETYPFRVGLLDALLAEFRSIFWVHPLYVFWSLIVGIYRIFLGRQVSKYSGAGFRRLPNMWDTSDPAGEQYTYLSHTHKLLAAIYYFINIRAAVRLGDGVYYARGDAVPSPAAGQRALFHAAPRAVRGRWGRARKRAARKNCVGVVDGARPRTSRDDAAGGDTGGRGGRRPRLS